MNSYDRSAVLVSMLAVLAWLLAACTPSAATGPQPTTSGPQPAAPPAVNASPVATTENALASPINPPAADAETSVPTADALATASVATAAPGETPTTVVAIETATVTAGAPAAAAVAPAAAAAPACTPGVLTPAMTEGPYYKANPPEEQTLVQPGMTGTRLTITGYVLDATCQPIPGARVDFWQADAEGQYDNQGYTLRGYQLTDAEGRYRVETVMPGLYPGRTRHIHVTVTPPDAAALTTQLFFPGEAANARDGIFAQQNVLDVQQTADGETAAFNFVVAQ